MKLNENKYQTSFLNFKEKITQISLCFENFEKINFYIILKFCVNDCQNLGMIL